MSRAALLLALALSTTSATAATYRVDEAGTFPQQSTAPMRWRHVAPGRGSDNTIEGSVTINVRLNLAPWLNRRGRLFMVLPEQPITPVRASWTTQGRLSPGQLVSGQRAQVYAGPITSPLLADALVLKLETDGARMTSAQQLNFHFEIDVD